MAPDTDHASRRIVGWWGVTEAASGRDRAGQRDGEGATDCRIVGRGFSPRLPGASDGSWDAV
jgi:hypothetical protein